MEDQANQKKESYSKLQRFFFLQPTLGILLSLLAILGGYFCINLMTKEALPDLEIPQVIITTEWPGADPESVEQQVTKPLEKELKTLKGLDSINSASFTSYSIIAVEFKADIDVFSALTELREKVDKAEGEFPDEADKPTVDQVSVDDRPILSLALDGDVSSTALNQAAEDIEDTLEDISGVNEIELGGNREVVIKILLDPQRMREFGISASNVRAQIISANQSVPVGKIEHDERGAQLRLAGKLSDVEEIRQLPISRLGENGEHLVRLKDVASVARELEREKKEAFLSWLGQPFTPTIELSVKKTPGADTLAVIEQVKTALDDLKASDRWPNGLGIQITQNGGTQISDSLSDVAVAGLQSMVAVFLVILLLLTWREGLIAGVSIPISLFAALIAIYGVGFTLNELVVIGMVLALGLLVDVFILMMEGLHQGIYGKKLSFNEAAIGTLRQYAVPAAAGTFTTVLALMPLMGIGGTAGKFIQVLPFSAIVCLISALIVALVISVPVSRFLLANQQNKRRKPSRMDQWNNQLSEKLKDWSLRTTLSSKWIASACILAAFLVLILGGILFSSLPLVMYPKSDGLKMGITIELPTSTTLPASREVADTVGEYLREQPYLESVVKLVGQKSPMAQRGITDALQPVENESFIGFSIVFKPLEEREKEAYLYGEDIRQALSEMLADSVPAATIEVVSDTKQPETIAPVELQLSGSDFNQLIQIADEVSSMLRGLEGTNQVSSNLGNLQSQINFQPDREALSFFGLSQEELGSQLSIAMSMSKIEEFQTEGTRDNLDIRLGTSWPHRPDDGGGAKQAIDFTNLYVSTERGWVPLLSLGEISRDLRPQSILHNDGQRTITLTVNDIGERDTAEVVSEVDERLQKMKGDWPSDVDYSIGGELESTGSTFGSAGLMLLLAVLLIYSVLVLLYSSFVQAFIVIATMPLSLIGTFYGFFLIQYPFTFFAMVGIISLMGIVVNNAIVMVDTMNSRLKEGLNIAEAAAHGAADRLRPIISTSLTTIVGLTPLAISSPMWRPLCFAIIFGLIAATFLSLLIVPCFYWLFTPKSKAE